MCYFLLEYDVAIICSNGRSYCCCYCALDANLATGSDPSGWFDTEGRSLEAKILPYQQCALGSLNFREVVSLTTRVLKAVLTAQHV